VGAGSQQADWPTGVDILIAGYGTQRRIRQLLQLGFCQGCHGCGGEGRRRPEGGLCRNHKQGEHAVPSGATGYEAGNQDCYRGLAQRLRRIKQSEAVSAATWW
jgi:hypothetical protein